jgi:membrane carboxypeptidase/penicillin-binding protein
LTSGVKTATAGTRAQRAICKFIVGGETGTGEGSQDGWEVNLNPSLVWTPGLGLEVRAKKEGEKERGTTSRGSVS